MSESLPPANIGICLPRRGLFEAYMEDPRLMPPHIVGRAVGETSMPRVIADYIAGMTDRFAFEEYAKLYDPFEKV